ncbi:MAG: hypothetical protein PWQ77_1430 [Kosmotogales bacterium]|nr:hypothetical protein [Kosmotogales bacterium]
MNLNTMSTTEETNYYEIAISNLPLNGYFTYSSKISLKPGQRVHVDFSNKSYLGYVHERTEKPEYKTKEILEIIDKESYLSKKDMSLIEYTCDKFHTPPGKIFDLFFPPGKLLKKIKYLYPVDSKSILSETTRYDIALKKFGKEQILNDTDKKYSKELFSFIAKNNYKKKSEKFLEINIPLYNTYNYNLTSNGEKIVDFLLSVEYIDENELIKKMALKSRSSIKTLLKNKIIKYKEIEKDDENWNIERIKALTPEQENIYKNIFSNFLGIHLLHGLTGTGKTEIYFKLMEIVLNKGYQVLYMVPEVSLTPQLLARMRGFFPGRILGTYNSYLPNNQRVSNWLDAKEKNINILVGTRSSIWLPLDNLGLIIIDEEHDTSYYNQNNPFFDSIDIAIKKAELLNIPLILGSATPRIDHYQKALDKHFYLHELKNRPKGKLPEVEIIDMKKNSGSFLFSARSLNEIKNNLKKNLQTFIFVNRKGYSNYIVCQKCGHIIKCPNCSISMSYHKSKNIFKCHYCNHSVFSFTECPECKSKSLIARGYGTEKVENEIRKIFPEANVSRIDKETIENNKKFEKILKEISLKKIDIIVGTKMISKGLDFPDVGLVIVLDSDKLINIPGYYSNEIAFQQINQVIGRSGRGKKGRAIIQTYNEENELLKNAINSEYETFYNNEIELRKNFAYPPYMNFIQISIKNKDEKSSLEDSKRYLMEFTNLNKSISQIFGPIKPFVFKINNEFIHTINIKAEKNYQINYPEVAIKSRVEIVVNPYGNIL